MAPGLEGGVVCWLSCVLGGKVVGSCCKRTVRIEVIPDSHFGGGDQIWTTLM